MLDNSLIDKAVITIKNSKHAIALTGAGLSVESGIPPFRGEGGLWTKYDPSLFTLSYFMNNPEDSWKLLKELFYESFKNVKPNEGHIALAEMEKQGYLKTVITQNIDGLHQAAGSKNVIEYHGGIDRLICMKCSKKYKFEERLLVNLPPRCECGGILKPDIVFFEELIQKNAIDAVEREVSETDLLLVIGTSAIIYPAAQIPYDAKRKKAKIIEINPNPSAITDVITDIFICARATEALSEIKKRLCPLNNNQ